MILFHYCPLPPKQNGIADYAARVNAALRPLTDLVCVNENPFSIVPEGLEIIDPLQAWRNAPADALPIYQIGNNPDHLDIYRQALERPGIVVLHDLRLFYLHELLHLSKTKFAAMMLSSNPILARSRCDDILEHHRKISSDYLCFDMVWDLIQRSRMIMVHSHYARNVLMRNYGPGAAERISVIPHFALRPDAQDVADFRARNGIPETTKLIVSSGFATKVKRFDWIAEAAAKLIAQGHDIHWIHAGAERREEFDLSGAISRYPELADRTTVTGYLSEEDLDRYISAADIVLNLRFPSVGESSGTLARALAAGRCCVVTKTAAYDEYPDDVVVKVPPFNSVESLSKTLEALLELPEARLAFARNGLEFANTRLSLTAYAQDLLDLCHRAVDMQPMTDVALLNRREDHDTLTLGPFAAKDFNQDLIEKNLPHTFLQKSFRLRVAAADQIFVDVHGLDAARTPSPSASTG